MSIGSNIQTEFHVPHGRGWKTVSIIDKSQSASTSSSAWVGDGYWDAWCKRMAEKESRRPERTRKFIEDGLKHGVYRIEGSRVVITEGNVRKACFCMAHGDSGHCGELYWKAMKGYDWERHELLAPESEVKKAVEDWLTDNWFNYLGNVA